MAKVGKRSQAKLNSVSKRLGDVVGDALWAAPGYLDFAVISGTRTAEEQALLYAIGRKETGARNVPTITNCDGYKKKSRHQPPIGQEKGQAVDIASFKGNTISWDDTDTAAVAAYVIGFAKAQGIDLTGGVAWGWDFGHIELKE